MFSIPVWAQDSSRLDNLFADLQAAPADQGAAIEDAISQEWAKSGSAAIDLLFQRGNAAMDAGDYLAAIEHFTAAIDHAPDFAAAYNGRAAAYYLTNRIGPAIDDLRQALVLEPRHFVALRGFGAILEELGREEDALEVYKQALALHPTAPDLIDAARRLELKLAGQSI